MSCSSLLQGSFGILACTVWQSAMAPGCVLALATMPAHVACDKVMSMCLQPALKQSVVKGEMAASAATRHPGFKLIKTQHPAG